ncbi:MAG TPA: glycoside hydrolase family 2 TIM barrel-domain containing protein [Pedobacter sp.]|uniref:glycoside hydrolase family 2 protein n=1 Tax=Pedobacter sp. TaxID=1411316 RepID=UPI002B7BFD49|nr:glycoside hydrolase family 2 TIM barrel-domain containing protein [Pedobacter sp.]HMI05499.1 glycoside hydrolase family 2 TIM barrel-domain containing protein [Pedobacter sp.]
MKKILLQLLFSLICFSSFSQGTIIKYLSGTDKDHTVQWDFYCTAGRKSGEWTKIPVPSNWELQGFGAYNYGHDKDKASEQGLYKHEFLSENWTNKKVFIVFEGSMTDTKVMINGKEAGPVHQGSFYRFKYDITGLIKPNGKNLLEVTVSKMSTNTSVNTAERKSDFWVFGGIFRPVYLEVVPNTFIERTAVNAKADGSFQLDVYAKNLKGDERIEAQVQKLNGENVGKPFSVKADASLDHLELKNNFTNPQLWSAEFPNLYQVAVTIKDEQGTIHQMKHTFGFRTVELRLNDGFYVNDAKVIMKGSNRHSFWPESGRTLSHKIHLMDVRLMKEMNMNAVRMSHYPPDADFLDVCDSLGLYVLDELTGWQAKYDSEVGHKLVKELVVRDVNHPSVVFWDNGNEGGWNTELDNDYALYDPQKRTVIHPWEKFNGTDTKHYQDYKAIEKTVATGQEVFFPTEFMHGLYDGGAGAALDDFWSLMMKHPHAAGGFIWAFIDEAVIRTDKNGAYDSDGNHGADGIVGPHREKEASYYTIKEIWSPVYIDPKPIDGNFKGEIAVENRYSFTNLNQCTFKWKLVKFPSAQAKTTAATVAATGTPAAPGLKPGEKGVIKLSLPSLWSKNDALYLTAYGPDKKEIFTWSWAITAPAAIAKKINAPSAKTVKSGIKTEETDQSFIVKGDGINYYFDKATGYIQKVVKPSGTISLSGGPVLAGVSTALKEFSHKAAKGQYVVEADYQGAGALHLKWTFAPGQPVKLEYQHSQQGDADFTGITFNYPEEKITGMKWLGRGPFRVWQNRLKGQQFGVWHKAYNNTITGETFEYPEFKGYHAEVNWVVIENKESSFTVYTPDKNMYLQMLRPAREKDALKNNNVEPAFPEGSIGFLNSISPIGTKFQGASQMGPQSQKGHHNGGQINGTLWFDFSGNK